MSCDQGTTITGTMEKNSSKLSQDDLGEVKREVISSKEFQVKMKERISREEFEALKIQMISNENEKKAEISKLATEIAKVKDIMKSCISTFHRDMEDRIEKMKIDLKQDGRKMSNEQKIIFEKRIQKFSYTMTKRVNDLSEEVSSRTSELATKHTTNHEDISQLKEEVAMLKTEDLPWLSAAVRGMQQMMDTFAHFMQSQKKSDIDNIWPPMGEDLTASKPRELDMTPMDALVSTHDSFIDFTQDTTIHGVRKVFNYDYSKGKRIRHAMFFLLALTWCCTMSGLAVRRYFSYPVTSSTEVIYPKSIEFPAITICNKNPMKKSYYEAHKKNGTIYPGYENSEEAMTLAFLKQQVNLGKMDINFTLDENITYSEVKAKMGHNQWTEFRNKDFMAKKYFDFVDEYKHMIDGGHQIDELILRIYTENNHTSFIGYLFAGSFRLCHTMIFFNDAGKPLHVHNDRLVWFLIDFLADEYVITDSSPPEYYIQIHPVGERPDMSAFAEKWLTVQPEENTIHVKRQDVMNLPKPYGASECATNTSLKYYSRYTKHGCKKECAAETEIEKCGCKVWPDRPGPGQVCNYTTSRKCDPQYDCSHCLPACESRTLTASFMHSPRKYSQILITHEISYTVISQSVAYPGTSLLGEVGGLLGLCMGASLLTLVELLDLAISMVNGLGIAVMAVRRQHRNAFYYIKNKV